MLVNAHTEPGTADRPNEDWVSASPGLVVVLDGVTTRTDTGCTHGTSWYAAGLGSALIHEAEDPAVSLRTALGIAIATVAEWHRACDLAHPASPAAAVGILRVGERTLDYLVLADVTIVLDTDHGLHTIVDARVDATAVYLRAR
jgi:hypothetical protein